MTLTELFLKLGAIILSHNEFLPEENEYDDGDDHNNPIISENEQQIYSTRLYVLLLNVILLMIILFTLFYSQTYITTINSPSFSTYKKLFNQYSNFLSCPCSTITIPYQSFVSINYSRHPLCSFVNEEWILAFYIQNHSYFKPMDFRAVASAQVNKY